MRGCWSAVTLRLRERKVLAEHRFNLGRRLKNAAAAEFIESGHPEGSAGYPSATRTVFV